MDAKTSATPPIAIIRDKELLKDAETIVYKKSEQGELVLHCFYPEGHSKEDHRCAVILFHGGKWDQAMSTQFVPQALNFASSGAVAITVEYRVSSKHNSTPIDAIQDAQTAILWVRKNNRYLGVDPEKIIGGGSGSGAHIALCAAMHKKVEHDGFFSGTPNALILWSSIIDTTKRGTGYDLFPSKRDARRTSPTKHIRRKLPPMLFFHGKADPVTPVASVDKFCQRLRSKRNIARFVPFNRATHSFFNFNVNQQYFVQTLDNAEGFLIEQGFLTPEKTDVIG
ncbi:alpha/beta hydrolase [Rubritalea spongiae]|uniref:Alpha/beta hydrolase n=1 Tax=Rubritalea spongiae TaxID=430797 RepID=A0ABW5DZU0_9BACT